MQIKILLNFFLITKIVLITTLCIVNKYSFLNVVPKLFIMHSSILFSVLLSILQVYHHCSCILRIGFFFCFVFFSTRTMLHASKPGQSKCGWRITRSGPCHGQHHLQTWTTMKTSGMWSRGICMVTSHQKRWAAWIFAPGLA